MVEWGVDSVAALVVRPAAAAATTTTAAAVHVAEAVARATTVHGGRCTRGSGTQLAEATAIATESVAGKHIEFVREALADVATLEEVQYRRGTTPGIRSHNRKDPIGARGVSKHWC